MKTLQNYIAMCFLLLVPFSLKGELHGENDFQLWFYDAVVFPLNPKLKWYLETESRFGDNASQYYLFYAQTRFQFLLSERLEIAPGYRQLLLLRTSDRKWEDLYMPFLEATLKLHLCKWKISDRNRVEYIFFESRKNAWIYRNRVTIKTPWELGQMKFNPIVFDEVFFRERSGVFQNRLGIGGEVPVNKHVKATVYYMMRHIDILGSWNRNNVLWLMGEFTF